MKKLLSLFSIESLSALLAWAVVTLSALYLMSQNSNFSGIQIALAGVYASVFLVAFLVNINDDYPIARIRIRYGLLALQYVAILSMAYLVPYNYIAIFITIWSAQLPYYIRFRNALMWSPVWSAPIWIIYSWHWQVDFAFLTATLFWTFNIFALVMVNATIKEKLATEKALALNRELRSTQALLGEATKQSERVRIARNIHDLLGHHLTAMTIHLQVASRMSEGDLHERIETCHSLSKLLLSDVREAVSEIREKSDLALTQALEALIDSVPELTIHLNISDKVHITDMHVAQVILRSVQESITNTLKHAQASEFSISLKQAEHQYQLRLRDNGNPHHSFKEGNGLIGMRERVTALSGQIDYRSSATGFETTIFIPEST